MSLPGAARRTLYGPPAERGLPRRALGRRPCAVEGCSTILSSYNLSDTCWMHEAMETPEGPARRGLMGIRLPRR
jgi:hypothetical protein